MSKISAGYYQVIARLRRTTTSGAYIPEIDGLRFLTLAAIFIYHVHGLLIEQSSVSWAVPVEQDRTTLLLKHWYYAVHGFFAISGFVLGLPFALHYLKGERPVSLRQYYLRRLTRLEPPYIANLLIIFVLLTTLSRASLDLLPHLVASSLYLHNVLFGVPSAVNGVAWTLEIEVQFYLLAPLMARVFAVHPRMARRALLVGLAYAAIILQWWLEHDTVLNATALDLSGLNLTIVNYLQFFLLGFLLADVYVADWNRLPVSSVRWDALALASLPALWLVWQFPDLSYFIFPALLFTFYVAVFRACYVRRVCCSSLITTIGGMCYTIYLFHFQVAWVVVPLSARVAVTNLLSLNLILQTLLVGSFVLASSIVFFLLVEKPCMDKTWHIRLLQRMRA